MPRRGVKVDIKETIESAQRALTVNRVFGEPIQQGGITIIPVARVRGGAGGGEGEGPEGQGEGEGSGFGLSATPMGVFVVRGDQVTWQPAVEVTRVIVAGLAVAVMALLTVRASIKARAVAVRETIRSTSRRR